VQFVVAGVECEPMKSDDQMALLKEIRDLQREQLSLLRKQKVSDPRDKKLEIMMFVLHAIYNALIILFVIGGFYYFYHSVVGLV
jgi:hypothetical protein